MAKLVNKNQDLKPDVKTGLAELADIVIGACENGKISGKVYDSIVTVFSEIRESYNTHITPPTKGTPREILAAAQLAVAAYERSMVVDTFLAALTPVEPEEPVATDKKDK